jgi:hypothetical protein
LCSSWYAARKSSPYAIQDNDFFEVNHGIGKGLLDCIWVQRQIACFDPDWDVGILHWEQYLWLRFWEWNDEVSPRPLGQFAITGEKEE